MPEPELVKMSTLARRSGVPAGTIKHYLREGLLPEPARRTGRNMAYYDARLVSRIRAIKRIQQQHFLPLKLIKDVLDVAEDVDDDATVAAAIQHVLERTRPQASQNRAELVASGVDASDLDWLEGIGLITPLGEGDDASYSGDDLVLLRTLGGSRKAGITKEMLPKEILEPYMRAISELVRVELEMFKRGVLPHAGDDLSEVTEAATLLSERLVVLMRRKLLLPTLHSLAKERRK